MAPTLLSFFDNHLLKRRMNTAKSRPDISEVPPLHELITPEQYEALSCLSDKVKMTLDPLLGGSVCLGESDEWVVTVMCLHGLNVSFLATLTYV